MRKSALTAAAVLVLAVLGGLAFAGGSQEGIPVIYAATRIPDRLLTAEITPTQEIQEYFSGLGVDGSLLSKDVDELTTAQKSTIDEAISDNYDTVTEMVNSALYAELRKGESEKVQMRIGWNIWSATRGDLD